MMELSREKREGEEETGDEKREAHRVGVPAACWCRSGLKLLLLLCGRGRKEALGRVGSLEEEEGVRNCQLI